MQGSTYIMAGVCGEPRPLTSWVGSEAEREGGQKNINEEHNYMSLSLKAKLKQKWLPQPSVYRDISI
jgi:hypothetical protein